MDTVIANKYSSILNELNIEVSKKLEGEFDVDEIISTFGNYFFNKMFLDITAIKDYKNLTNLQKLSMGINMDKVILLLDKEDPISDSNVFLSKLVGMGIYNFTKNKNNLMYLYTNPNLYRDVAYLQDVTIDDLNRPIISTEKTIEKRMIGIKNITDSAGASTLIYLLKRELKEYYKVMALEIDKRDFAYFKDEDMINIREMELENIQNKYNDIEIFLVDLNKSKKDYLCNDVLYLIEPSTIKLNRLMTISPYIFQDLNGQKVVLNKSLLTESEIADFEEKSNIKIYYNIPPLNDKKNNDEILLPLLEKLGYIKVEKETPKKRKNIFNLFK